MNSRQHTFKIVLDFFNGEVHSKIHFHSEKFDKKGDKEVLHGNLYDPCEMAKPVVVDAEFGGIDKDSSWPHLSWIHHR